MSVLDEIERINSNVSNAYSTLEDMGADIPTERNTNNLAGTLPTIKVVRFDEQTLTEEQKSQARANIGIIGTGEDGYTPIKGVDYFTEEDKAEIVKDVIESLGGNPVFGYVDENNNIILSGNLAKDTYSVKYEMEDGSTVDIGSLVLSNEESEEPEEPAEYTNFCVPDGDGWIDGGRCSSAGEDRTDNQGYYLTNYIAVKNGDVVYVKNFDITTTTPVNQYCGMYDAEKAPIKGFIMTDSGATGYCKDIDLSGEVEQFTIDNANAGYVRIVGGLPSGKTKADIVINIKRDGQWL